MKPRCYVLGNGESRKNWRPPPGEPRWTIGCNAAYRDGGVDEVVCSGDTALLAEMLQNSNLVTWCGGRLQRALERAQLSKAPDNFSEWPFDWHHAGGAGVMGLSLALETGFTDVLLVGFDGGPHTHSIYDGTPHYPRRQDRTHSGFPKASMINSIRALVAKFPEAKIRYRPPSSYLGEVLDAE